MASSPTSDHTDTFDFVINKGNGVKGLSDTNPQIVPQNFIQPTEKRLDFSKVVTEQSIPIIDVSNWDDDPMIAQSICEAARELGFFQIINHGVPGEVMEGVKEASHRFFGLPVEERRKFLRENSKTHSVELKSSFSPHTEKALEWKDYLLHIYDDDEDTESTAFWPSVSKDQVLEYMKYAKPIITRLLKVLMKGLNVEEIDEEKKSALMGTLIVNLIYYPKCPNPDFTAGAGPHSDVSTITVLLQDDTGGLYVRGSSGDRWIHITPIKDALVINIGDVLQIMSNDRYKSVEHRVVVNGSKNRVSVPIFVNPRPNAVIGPLPEVLEGEEKPMYKQVLYSDYFNYFFSKAHDGKHTIDFAKI